MRSFWKIWVNAKTEEKSLKLRDRFFERIEKSVSEVNVEPYPKTSGFVVGFVIELENSRWNDAVIEAIGLGQQVGNSWQISGSVYKDPSGWSNKANVPGIESIEWIVLRDESDNAG